MQLQKSERGLYTLRVPQNNALVFNQFHFDREDLGDTLYKGYDKDMPIEHMDNEPFVRLLIPSRLNAKDKGKAEKVNNLRDFSDCSDDYFLMVSQRIKELIDSDAYRKHIQFIPIGLMNLNSELQSETQYLVHFLNYQDVLNHDLLKEEFKNSTGAYGMVRNFQIFDDKIDPNVAIFRLKNFPKAIILRESLANKIAELDPIGAELSPIENFSTFDFM